MHFAVHQIKEPQMVLAGLAIDLLGGARNQMLAVGRKPKRSTGAAQHQHRILLIEAPDDHFGIACACVSGE